MIKRFNFTILLVLLILGTQGIYANYAFYRTVTNTCKSYRIATQEGEMYFGTDKENNNKFYLTVKSNRNDFQMALLVGFISVGEAIKHQRSMVKKGIIKTSKEPKTIHVTVHVPVTRDDMIITASATAEQVMELTNGTINSAEFMRLIKNSMVTL